MEWAKFHRMTQNEPRTTQNEPNLGHSLRMTQFFKNDPKSKNEPNLGHSWLILWFSNIFKEWPKIEEWAKFGSFLAHSMIFIDFSRMTQNWRMKMGIWSAGRFGLIKRARSPWDVGHSSCQNTTGWEDIVCYIPWLLLPCAAFMDIFFLLKNSVIETINCQIFNIFLKDGLMPSCLFHFDRVWQPSWISKWPPFERCFGNHLEF